MRLYCVVLLVAVAFLTGTNASEQSSNVKISSPNARGLSNNALISADNEAPTKRVLRKRESADDIDEERGFKELVERAVKKTKKLAKYNKWIFADRSPEWVKANFPKYAKGYEKFWENRMVPGGKYH